MDLYSLLSVQTVADVRHGRLRWFGHLEHKGEYDHRTLEMWRWQTSNPSLAWNR